MGAPRPLKSIDELWDFIAVVVLCAPDKFPRRDYLADDEQMNLDRAFVRLRQGISVAYPDEDFGEKKAWLNDALDRSLAAYQQGDDRGGAHILQGDFQDMIFKHD